MATVILLRHGRTTANASGVLAGRLPGVNLDATGREQARAAGRRLAEVRLSAVLTSPMARCRETARLALEGHPAGSSVRVENALAECDYGTWQGRPLKELAEEPLWQTVQRHPSHATFPEGESLRTMQHRAVAAVRRADAEVEAEHGPGAAWLLLSHGDIIKAVLADALGMHLDAFQRLVVDPASASVVRYSAERPYVVATNTHSGSLAWLTPPGAGGEVAGETVGGGAGPAGDGSAGAGPAGDGTGQHGAGA